MSCCTCKIFERREDSAADDAPHRYVYDDNLDASPQIESNVDIARGTSKEDTAMRLSPMFPSGNKQGLALTLKTVASLRSMARRSRNATPEGITHSLDEKDFLISSDLARSLGLDESRESFAPNDPQHNAATKNIKSFAFAVHMKRKLQIFRDQMAAVPEANRNEISRGVQIEGVYDYTTFADFTKGKKHTPTHGGESSRKVHRVRKVGHEQYHARPEKHSSSESSNGSDSGGNTSSTGHRESTSSTGYRDSRRHSGGRSMPLNHEALTSWGVLCGKVVNSKVMDFKGTVSKLKMSKHKVLLKESDTAKGKVMGSVRMRALAVLKRASEMARQIAREKQDIFDHEWIDQDLMNELFSNEAFDVLSMFANTARKIFSVQPSLVHVEAPCKVFGDTHGQFRDLLLLLRAFGSPDEKNSPMFVFNGDFVDRGRHQVELVGLLLAFKVALPEKVFMLRGNHEDRTMNKRYGFYDECSSKFGRILGEKVFELIHKAFDMLPMAALINDRVLVVHGGIGNGTFTLPDLNDLPRPMAEGKCADPWIFNLLWSDPIEEDDPKKQDVFGVHDSPRGGEAVKFGWNVSKTFCARNGLSLIIRSHQSKKGSPGFDIMHDKLVMRVFSARDYEHQGNDGAILSITPVDEHDPNSMLKVRPQVLRSHKKANLEE